MRAAQLPQRYYWELVVVSQKFVLVGLLSQLSQGSFVQAIAGVTAAIGFLVLHLSAQPFRQAAVLQMEPFGQKPVLADA